MLRLWKWFKINIPWLFSGIALYALQTLDGKIGSEKFSVTWSDILQSCVLLLIAYFFFSLLKSLIRYLTRKNFWQWLKHKNIELFWLLIEKKKLFIDTEKKYECYELHQEYLNNIILFKEYICFAQSWLAQYSFIAGEKHKEIKDILRESEIDKKKLNDLCIELYRQLTAYQERIFDESCNKLLEHFKKRSPILPRICLKAVVKNEKDENIVFAVFREDNVFEYTSEYRSEERRVGKEC